MDVDLWGNLRKEGTVEDRDDRDMWDRLSGCDCAENGPSSVVLHLGYQAMELIPCPGCGGEGELGWVAIAPARGQPTRGTHQCPTCLGRKIVRISPIREEELANWELYRPAAEVPKGPG